MRVSVIVAVLNEQEVVGEMAAALVGTLQKVVTKEYEIIFVNDGSTDATLQILLGLRAKNEAIKIVSLSRNFGHQNALTAGMDFARGDVVITMDGDLQHPPALIPAMLERHQQGYDIVTTVRMDNYGLGFAKRFFSGMFYRIYNLLSPVKLAVNTPDFCLYDRKVIEVLRNIREKERFLRGLTRWLGFRTTSITFSAARRRAGKSSYSFAKMFRLGVGGIFSFSQAPLRVSFFLFVFFSICAVFLVGWAFYLKFIHKSTIDGWTAMFILILFSNLCMFLTLWLQSEYIAQIYAEVKNRPLYVIDKLYGVTPDE